VHQFGNQYIDMTKLIVALSQFCVSTQQ